MFRYSSFLLPLCMFFLITMITGGCEKELICGESKNKGIITKSVDFVDPCMSWIVDQDFIIRSQEELDSLYREFECDSKEDAGIDFSESTLLGMYTSGGGCNIQFIREVERDEENKRYVFTVKIRECGICAMLGISMNWVLVPRLPETWTVEFTYSYE